LVADFVRGQRALWKGSLRWGWPLTPKNPKKTGQEASHRANCPESTTRDVVETRRSDVRILAAVFVVVALALASLGAQSTRVPTGALYGADPSFKVPRTADGHPDLQGVWSNNSVTPMTRPPQWKGRDVITEAELKELQGLVAKSAKEGGDAIFQNVVQLALDAKDKGKFDQSSYDKTTGNYNQFWMADHDWDTRTSLVIDPPDGQFPPFTPEGQARLASLLRQSNPESDYASLYNGPEDLPLTERCLTYGAPRTGAGYNSYVQIVQSPDVVVLQQEMIHDSRIVRTDRTLPHLPATVRQLHGDPRGWWEGDTLVVETTNYSNGLMMMGASPDMRVTERYTRVSRDYINWAITVDDPKTWTAPWTFMVRLKHSDDLIYEYACHEGNYAMTGMLAGARLQEKKAAEAAAKKGAR
jgi:hypothetical protein